MFIRTKFYITRLTQTYFTAFLYVLSDHPSYFDSFRVLTGQGKVREKWNFAKVREMSGNFDKISYTANKISKLVIKIFYL